MNTKVWKGRDGYHAKTDVALEAPYVLRFDTSKWDGTGVVTTVTRVKDTGDGTFSYILVNDFSKVVLRNKVRCTAQSVAAQHKQALAQVDELKNEVAAFYAKKEAA